MCQILLYALLVTTFLERKRNGGNQYISLLEFVSTKMKLIVDDNISQTEIPFDYFHSLRNFCCVSTFLFSNSRLFIILIIEFVNEKVVSFIFRSRLV